MSLTTRFLQYYPDKAAQREVSQLIVICMFKKLGCEWSDKLKDYEVSGVVCHPFLQFRCNFSAVHAHNYFADLCLVFAWNACH